MANEIEKPTATERQRALLSLAIRESYLDPNPFEYNYEKWKNLSADEADKILGSIPPKQFAVLEKGVQSKNHVIGGPGNLSRGIGQGSEEIVRQLGHNIEIGVS